jgi:hypothetical protein
LSSCFTCCKKKSPEKSTQLVVNSVSIAVMGTHIAHSEPTHHRERTWQMKNGKMTYEKKDEKEKKNEIS